MWLICTLHDLLLTLLDHTFRLATWALRGKYGSLTLGGSIEQCWMADSSWSAICVVMKAREVGDKVNRTPSHRLFQFAKVQEGGRQGMSTMWQHLAGIQEKMTYKGIGVWLNRRAEIYDERVPDGESKWDDGGLDSSSFMGQRGGGKSKRWQGTTHILGPLCLLECGGSRVALSWCIGIRSSF